MYVDGFFQKNGRGEIINIVERVNGERIYKQYKPDYHFYVSDPRGTHKTIYDTPVKRINPNSYAEKLKLLKTAGSNTKTWESDVDPIIRCLEQNYQHVDPPKLHVAVFDIETSFDKETGWSDAADANNYITSISVYLQWIEQVVCLAIPPSTITFDEAQELANKVGDVALFDNEADMLNAFLDIIQDADILTGWNSKMYDILYTTNRITKILGKSETRRLCLWDQLPKEKEFEVYGKLQKSYELIGRIHLDYLELYKKYNYEERQSYTLDSIAEIELGERKVQYDGTLDDLYNFDFEKFLTYNIQDTILVHRIDKKLQFIDLANQIAHANCVLLPSTMGAVAVTDQAVVMEAHSKNKVCPDKKRTAKVELESDELDENKAAGGWVAFQKKGIHKSVASTDMKSLYPSTIRALNMSPETIVAQLRLDRTNKEISEWMAKGGKHTFATWWNDRFNVLEMDEFYSQDIGTELMLDFENGDSVEITGKELHSLIFDCGQPFCISANGTIFRTDIEGIIPSLLTRWYNERKELQKKAELFNKINSGFELPDNIKDLFDE